MKSLLLVLPLLIFCFATGCRNETNNDSAPTPSNTGTPIPGSLLDSIQSQLNSAGSFVESVSPQAQMLQDRTVEEVEKLFQIEYKVADFPSDAKTSELESSLAGLGREGWECFSILPRSDKIQVACKRRPKSVLRYFKSVSPF